MTYKESITAILECYFTGFKEEIIDSACNRILEQEPRSGHWEKTIDGHCYWYKCSCCGTKAPKNEWGNDYFSPYCPNCGAKMQEVEE